MGQPHNKTGRVCRCGHVFTPQSMTMTISHRRAGMIEKELVCSTCHHIHHAKGE